MAEILTESFCERCGSRYTFEAAAGRRRGLGRIRTLSRGVKNFVANDDASFSDAMALARDEDERKASLQQLDAFHRTFNFCMTCRQYTCRNCWNSAAGECLSCAPDLSRQVLPAAFPDLTVVGPETAVTASAEALPPGFAPTAWPSTDVRVEAPPPSVVAAPNASAASAATDAAGGSEATAMGDAALASLPEAEPAVEFLATPEAAPEAESVPELAAEAEPTAIPEPGLEAVPKLAAEAETTATPEPGLEHVAAPPAEAAAASASRSTDESDLELTATELAAVEGALHRQVQRAESAAVASGTSDALPPAEGDSTGREEPVLGGQAETRRFFQRFRLARGRPATSVSTTPMAATGEAAAPEPVAEPEFVTHEAEVAAVAPEPVPEPEFVAHGAEAAANAAPEPTLEPEALVVEVEAAQEATPEPEPVEVAAAAQEATPEPEPVEDAAAAREPAPKPQPVDVVKQPTWRMVAPDGTAAGEAQPAPPIWTTTPAAATRRPAEPMPTAGWASRVATARPVESPVWVASSRDVVAAAPPGVAAPVGIHSCVSCGLSLSANARFCRRCGSRQG